MPTPAESEEQVRLERDQIDYGLKKLRANTRHLEEKEYASASVYGASSVEVLLPLVYEDGEFEVKDRLYEPSKEILVGSLVPRHLNIQVWKYLLESYASEQAARMFAMDNATTNAGDMIKNLTLEFNKARQAAITTEMLEIVSGAEALK